MFLSVQAEVRFINLLTSNGLIESKFASRDESLADEPTLLTCGSKVADFRGVITNHRIRIQSHLQVLSTSRIQTSRRRCQRRIVLGGDLFEIGERQRLLFTANCGGNKRFRLFVQREDSLVIGGRFGWW